MSKTRRNFAAAKRHIKGFDDYSNKRFNRFVKKMKKKEYNNPENENSDFSKINHKNYNEFINDEDIYDEDVD
jgi:hypothetical protein